MYGGGHYIGDCTPNCDQGQSEVKQSWQNFEACQMVKRVEIGDSFGTVKGSLGHQWVWLMLDSKGQGQIFSAVKGSDKHA